MLLQLTGINGVGVKGTNCHQSKTAVNAYGRKEGIAKFNSWCTSTKEGGDGFVNRSTSCLEEFKSFWKSTEEDKAYPVSTPPESPESVVGAGDVGITDKSKSDGDSTTEIFDRIDPNLEII